MFESGALHRRTLSNCSKSSGNAVRHRKVKSHNRREGEVDSSDGSDASLGEGLQARVRHLVEEILDDRDRNEDDDDKYALQVEFEEVQSDIEDL